MPPPVTPVIIPVEALIAIVEFFTSPGMLAPFKKFAPESKLYSNFDKSLDILMSKSPGSFLPIEPTLIDGSYSTVWFPS